MASSWNGANTWEEKDVSNWAAGRLQELVEQCSYDENGVSIKTQSIKICQGDAVIRWIKGKKRIGYELELGLKWEGECSQGDAGDVSKFKGTLDFPEICEDNDDLQYEAKISAKKAGADGNINDFRTRAIKPFENIVRKAIATFVEELSNK